MTVSGDSFGYRRKRTPTMQSRFHQAGLTLLEISAGLVLASLVLAGSLALFDSTRTSQASTGLANDLVSIRQSVRMVKQGRGTYGTASLDSTLIASGRLPPTLRVSGSTINTSYGGTLAITGATSAFSIVLTTIPRAACITLLSSADNGWTSVKVGAGAALTTFPITPDIANDSTHCGAAATSYTLTFVAS